MNDEEDRAVLIQKILNQGSTPKDYDEMIDLLLEKKVSQDTTQKKERTFANRVSDKMAAVAGSWTFIIAFMVLLGCWIVLNAVFMIYPFDPYPYILLNLVLSCMAAIQAPIIMMSQNRQEKKDRIRAQNDYKVNLKSELILEDMHAKLDILMQNHQSMLKKWTT